MSAPPGAHVLHGGAELQRTVGRLAGEVSAAFPAGVLLVAVLKGSVFFLADLVRRMTVPCEVDFLGISAYAAGTGRVRITKDLDHDVLGRDVVLVEDIVDTGLTCSYVLGQLAGRAPGSLEVCALFDRLATRIVPVDVRFRGYEVEDDLLLGYGLDIAGRYRNLPFVAAGDRRALDADPDAHVEALYGR
ncbi:MAG TPA: phosphoribosyltransferase family protein [Acidimicrobiales bacterium]|nr:phosphoribosyltransferase family protein [Acidimicrobiales bacterium]